MFLPAYGGEKHKKSLISGKNKFGGNLRRIRRKK